MKINLRVVIPLVLIVVIGFWAVDSVRQRSYSGSNLTFAVGSGAVTVTNPSDEAVPVRLVSSETRAFSVSSAIDGVAGTSAREGTGREAVHVVTFELPSGVSEFTVTRGRNVNFAATTTTNLEATVQPMNASETRMTLIAVALVILAALYYISRTIDHRWMSGLRRQVASDLAARKLAERVSFKRIMDRTRP